jgi:tetratricopeptide (TPR) repeat protein
MAKTILTVVLIVLLNILVGCHNVDSGQSQLITARMRGATGVAPMVEVAKAGESDIVEQVAINRQAYLQSLELLVDYYKKTGNNMKLVWAEKELASLKGISQSQYNYVIEASVASPNLTASTSITEADYMYDDALRTEKKAKELAVIVDEDLLRAALDKYNLLIRKHPSSDKIDDAAFRIGGIAEYFRDYTIAVLYYQRAYQWDPNTIHPARFKAAYILDTHLHRRGEALKLYQEAVKKEGLKESYKEFAERRINELTSSGESLEESK